MARELRFGFRITGDPDSAIRALNRTDRELRDLRREMVVTQRRTMETDRAFRRWSGSVTNLRNALGPLVGVIGVGLVTRAARQQLEFANQVGKSAKAGGVMVETLQELRFAFGQLTDVTDRQVDESLLRFNRRMGLAVDGTGAAADTFGELGISLLDLRGNVRDTEQVLEEALDRLAEIENDATRAAKASELFGDRVGPKLASALNRGIQPMRDLRQEAQEMGIVLSNDVVENAEAVTDQFDKGSRILRVTFLNALNHVMPTLIRFADVLGRALGNWKEFLSDTGTAELNRLRGRLDQLLATRQRLIRQGAPESQIERLTSGPGGIQSVNQQIQELQQMLMGNTSGVSFGGQGGSDPVVIPINTAGSRGGGGSFRQRRPPANLGRDRVELERRNREILYQFEVQQQMGQDVNETYREMGILIDESTGMIIDLGEQGGESIQELEARLKRLNQEGQNMTNWGEQMGLTMASAFEEAILKADDFRGILQGLARDLQQMAVRQTVTIPLGNALGDWIQGLQQREHGGPVTAGQPYIVGEKRPEIFVPDSNGTIVPHAGGMAVSPQVNIDARGADMRAARNIAQSGRDIARQVTSIIVSDIQRNGPIARAMQRRRA